MELASLKDEWHITVERTRLYESTDGRDVFLIMLRNSSTPVTLVESSKVLGCDITISAQIDNIFVSIKEQEGFGTSSATITEPYEQRIDTLKEGESVTLEFELIKENVRDVVVALKYSDEITEKNIHLKQEDPYISVVSARRYKEGERCRLEVVVTYGAVKGEAEEIGTRVLTGYSEGATAQEINNIYVAIKDETESIIGYPYEHRISTLKDGQEKPSTLNSGGMWTTSLLISNTLIRIFLTKSTFRKPLLAVFLRVIAYYRYPSWAYSFVPN